MCLWTRKSQLNSGSPAGPESRSWTRCLSRFSLFTDDADFKYESLLYNNMKSTNVNTVQCRRKPK